MPRDASCHAKSTNPRDNLREMRLVMLHDICRVSHKKRNTPIREQTTIVEISILTVILFKAIFRYKRKVLCFLKNVKLAVHFAVPSLLTLHLKSRYIFFPACLKRELVISIIDYFYRR